MSYGLDPAEFVKQVYYTQEKVLLDFDYDDDKYKEVIYEANLVLQELQKEEDWHWLRERLVLGYCGKMQGPTDDDIPEFQLPPWAYKVSTLHDDGLMLYRARHNHLHHGCYCNENDYDPRDFISVPFASVGSIHSNHMDERGRDGRIFPVDRRLTAVQIGDIVTFNRPLFAGEAHRVAVCDVQRRIKLLHVCTDECQHDKNGKNICEEARKPILMEIPDPNYVVVKTAACHAEGSPPAQGRIMGLQDQAQKLLSAMRENNAAATMPDTIEWDYAGYVDVI